MQSHESIEALATGYVMGTLDEDEAAEFVAHLTACRRCNEIVDEVRAVVAALADAVPQHDPSPALKARLLATVNAEAKAFGESAEAKTNGERSDRRALAPLPRLHRRRRILSFPAAAGATAAILLAAFAGMAVWAFSLQDRLEADRATISDLSEAMTVLAHADQRWELSAAEIQPGARGLLAHASNRQTSMLILWGLPPATGERTYTAWTVEDGQRGYSGTLRPSDRMLWTIIPGDVSQIDEIGITLRDEYDTERSETSHFIVFARDPSKR